MVQHDIGKASVMSVSYDIIWCSHVASMAFSMQHPLYVLYIYIYIIHIVLYLYNVYIYIYIYMVSLVYVALRVRARALVLQPPKQRDIQGEPLV